MQSLMFLGCFDQKLSKKNLLGGRLDPLLGKGSVNPIRPGLFSHLPGPRGLRGPVAKNQG